VFLLDSKSLHGDLSVERGVLSVRWREDPEDGYENWRLTPRMQTLARALGERFEQAGVSDAPIQPVVVLWGRFEQRSIRSKGCVAWIQGGELGATLRRQPAQISADDVARIGRVFRASCP
jgi:hypothetical protein